MWIFQRPRPVIALGANPGVVLHCELTSANSVTGWPSALSRRMTSSLVRTVGLSGCGQTERACAEFGKGGGLGKWRDQCQPAHGWHCYTHTHPCRHDGLHDDVLTGDSSFFATLAAWASSSLRCSLRLRSCGKAEVERVAAEPVERGASPPCPVIFPRVRYSRRALA